MVSTIAGMLALTLQVADPGAAAHLERAMDRMGGEEALRGVERVRYRMTTQWQRTTFDGRPYRDRPSYEEHTDVRDYTIPAWRNARDFGSRTVHDLVSDSVAARDFGDGWAPLSSAYVDERRELFTYTPDRAVLAFRDADDLALAGDTAIDGVPHVRLRATLRDRWPATLLLRRSDGLPAALFFRAGHPRDFGLVPWGEMDVEVWYSGWRELPGGLRTPDQWDIKRAGAPYKRITVRSVELDPELEEGFLHVPDEVRLGWREAAGGPMHDLPVDSVTAPAEGLAVVHGFGTPAGAVRVGDAWLLLEAGHTPLNLERARDRLRAERGIEVSRAVLTLARTGNGGVEALVREGTPVAAPAGAEPFARTMLAGRGLPWRGVEIVEDARWLALGGDSAALATVDLPDVRDAGMVHVPSLRWLYVGDAFTGLDVEVAVDH